MKQRIAKRVTTARYYSVFPRDATTPPDREYTYLLPHRLIRAQIFYDKYDTSQWLEHDNLGRRAVVARRKPRAGRRRR